MKLPALDQRWTLARCQFILICATAFVDRELAVEEEQEALALASRTRTLHGVNSEVTAEIFAEVRAAHRSGALWKLVDKAISDLPKDPDIALSIYAHCVDIAFADRRVRGSEHALLSRIAKRLRLDRDKRKLIDKVLSWKNEAR